LIVTVLRSLVVNTAISASYRTPVRKATPDRPILFYADTPARRELKIMDEQ
jgi:hypothetical protein